MTDRPELREAIAQTDGGVLVLGVGYELAAETPGYAPEPPTVTSGPQVREPCPECGTPTDEKVCEQRPDGSTVALLVCKECGAAWEV